jgi:hypothetical protein
MRNGCAFVARRPGAQVIAVIVGGEPGDADRECFPPALRVKIAPDSTPTGEPEEPIAADARPLRATASPWPSSRSPPASLSCRPTTCASARRLRISAIAGPQAERAREPRGLLGRHGLGDIERCRGRLERPVIPRLCTGIGGRPKRRCAGEAVAHGRRGEGLARASGAKTDRA